MKPEPLVASSHCRYMLFITGLLLLTMLSTMAQLPPFRWVVQAGGDSDDFSRGIAVDANGNSYVTGAFHDLANFGDVTLSSSGGYDIFVAKYDSTGSAVWAASAGGPDFDDYGLAIAADSSGNSYVTGAFSGQATFGTNTLSNLGGSDIFIAKYDTAGNLLWVQQAGGVSLNSGRSIAVDAAGNCFVTGVFQGTGAFGNTNLTAHSLADFDIFLAKYDPNGQLVWVQQAGGSLDDVGYGVAVDNSGNAVLTGYFKSPTASFGAITLVNHSPTNSPDIFIAKYDSAGNTLWATNAGGADIDLGYAVALDVAGNSYVSGVFSGSASFGGITLNNQGGTHFLAKYSSTGDALWAQIVNGGTDDGSGMLAVDAVGNSFLTGWFSDTATFGNTNLSSMGLDDVFAAKFDRDGNILWVKQAGGPNYDRGYGIAVDLYGNSYVAGFFEDTATFDNFSLTSYGGFDSFTTKIDGPRLTLSPQGNQVLISWPTNAAGLSLQVATSLTPPADWVNSPTSPVVVGDQNMVTNAISPGARFYRLKNL
jgi:beta-propeller repeat-containing protein